jgi:sugar (pentulose or hexulose) kinase
MAPVEISKKPANAARALIESKIASLRANAQELFGINHFKRVVVTGGAATNL